MRKRPHKIQRRPTRKSKISKLEKEISDLETRRNNLENGLSGLRRELEVARHNVRMAHDERADIRIEVEKLRSLIAQNDLSRRLPVIEVASSQNGQLFRNLSEHLCVKKAQGKLPYLLLMTTETFRSFSDVPWNEHANFESVPISLCAAVRDGQIAILHQPKLGWQSLHNLDYNRYKPRESWQLSEPI